MKDLRGVFTAIIKNLRKNKSGRYCLIVELEDTDFNKNISIDIHDSLYETTGLSKLNSILLSRIKFNFPSKVKISNLNGYWKIENESQLLSDVISKSL